MSNNAQVQVQSLHSICDVSGAQLLPGFKYTVKKNDLINSYIEEGLLIEIFEDNNNTQEVSNDKSAPVKTNRKPISSAADNSQENSDA